MKSKNRGYYISNKQKAVDILKSQIIPKMMDKPVDYLKLRAMLSIEQGISHRQSKECIADFIELGILKLIEGERNTLILSEEQKEKIIEEEKIKEEANTFLGGLNNAK